MRTTISIIAFPNRPKQAGISLIESLIALLVFSIGTLAFIGIYARSISTTADTQFRIEASNYANEVLQAINATVARDADGVVVATALNTYAHTSVGNECVLEGDDLAWNGPTSVPEAVRDWYCRIQLSAAALPGSRETAAQSIAVDSTPTAFNRVTVRLSWTVPSDGVRHTHEVIGHVN